MLKRILFRNASQVVSHGLTPNQIDMASLVY